MNLLKMKILKQYIEIYKFVLLYIGIIHSMGHLFWSRGQLSRGFVGMDGKI